MSTIVTRAGKGSALTHNEVDANFVNLNNDKLQGTVAVANGGTGATTVAAAQTNRPVDPAGTAVALAIALG